MDIKQFFQIHSVSSVSPGKVLKTGDTLFIRVLSQTAANKYTVAYSGGRFSLSSNISLKAGDSFLVKINAKPDTIELVPVKQEPIAAEQNFSSKIPVMPMTAENASLSPEIVTYMTSLGVPADTIFVHVFLQMRSLGMKIAPALMQKIWRVAKNFAGREKDAAEIAVALEQKGIAAEVKTVAAFMGAFAFGSESGKGRKNYFSGNDFANGEDNLEQADLPEGGWWISESEVESEAGEVISAEKIKEFFLGLLECKAGRKNRRGVLSLFNSIDVSQKDGKAALIFLPFEFSVTGEEAAGSGNFRVFSQGTEKKIGLSIFFRGRKYAFLIHFSKDKCQKIEAGISPEIQDFAASAFKKNFEQAVGIGVELRKFDELSGFGTDGSPIAVFRGEA